MIICKECGLHHTGNSFPKYCVNCDSELGKQRNIKLSIPAFEDAADKGIKFAKKSMKRKKKK